MNNNNFPSNRPEDDILSQSVKSLQDDLLHLSYHDGDILPVGIDGIFGEETERSLISFQKKYGLEQTGVADLETWERLRDISDSSRTYHSPTRQISIFPRAPQGYIWDTKSSPLHLMILQYVLDELSHEYSYGEIPLSGVYDEKTRGAVVEFQTKNGLNTTGTVDRRTWDDLARQYNDLFDSNR